VHDVQGAVEEREPPGDGAEVERDEPAGRHERAERRAEVEGRGHHGDPALRHARRERARAAADVEADPYRAPRLGGQHGVDVVVEVPALPDPPPPLLAGEVEARLAAVVVAVAVAPRAAAGAVHEARVVLARVGRPRDGLVRRDHPQALRERRRVREPGWPARAAPAPRQRLASPEHQTLRERRVGRAVAGHVVPHVLVELVAVAVARRADRRIQLVGVEVRGVAERERVRAERDRELLVRRQLRRQRVPLHLSGVGDEPLDDRVGGLDAIVEVDGEALAGGEDAEREVECGVAAAATGPKAGDAREGDGQEDGDGVCDDEEEEGLGAAGVVPLLRGGMVRRRRCMGGAAAGCAGGGGVHVHQRLVMGIWLSWIAFHDAHLQFMQCKSACRLPSSSIYRTTF
jgi:hypothetical protein